MSFSSDLQLVEMAGFTEYSYGGRTYAFTDPVGRMFECPICQGVVKKAHSVRCCKKTFCEGCLDEALNKFYRCPLCRAENPMVYENDAIDDGVNDFQVLCLHHAKGCEWRGHLLHEPQHREEKCGYEEIECERREIGCEVVDERRHMKKHIEEECEYREVPCEHCGDFQQIWEMALHRNSCPEYPVACVNDCSVERLLRKNIGSHQKVCPEAVVDCPFAEMGCQEGQLKRKDIESHTTSAVSHHLALVMKNLVETKQAMQKQADAHKAETEGLKAHIQQLQVDATAHRTQTDALIVQLQAEVSAATKGLKDVVRHVQERPTSARQGTGQKPVVESVTSVPEVNWLHKYRRRQRGYLSQWT